MKPQDIEDLKQLIEFLKEYQVAEFDLDRGDLKDPSQVHQPPATSAGLSDWRADCFGSAGWGPGRRCGVSSGGS